MADTVLTTGANSGLGLAIVLELARRGYRSVGSVRSDAKAAVVHEAATAAGVEVETVLLDVTDEAACARVLADLDLYGLVNNAGFGQTGAVEDVDDAEVREILETMVVAPMRLARLALPAMRAAGRGRIVNVSSVYGRTTTPLTGWYQGAKHALEAVSDALRVEVAGAGVRVILVQPGAFRTAIFDDVGRDAEKRAGSRFDTAYKRTQQLVRLAGPLMGEPQQVARVVAGALSSPFPRARYLVGFDAPFIAAAGALTPTPLKDLVTRFTLGL
ncbi:MAG: SDR family NAD(P)-dependent oxidoreductase [Acidimicrobiales bacterium]|nr:SDR family NAD(P)-dependent oxidoreductase [Acidimicrobiales bacterium]